MKQLWREVMLGDRLVQYIMIASIVLIILFLFLGNQVMRRDTNEPSSHRQFGNTHRDHRGPCRGRHNASLDLDCCERPFQHVTIRLARYRVEIRYGRN